MAITYRVIENPLVTKISFTGNKSVPNDTLLALMDLSVGQVFNSNTFRSDVLKINNYYERIGYGGQVPTHVADVNFDSKTGALSLTIREGLTVRAIIIGGDPVLPVPLVQKQLTLKPGMVFSDQIREKDIAALRAFYDDKFHLEFGNFEGGIDPATIDEKTGTADVKYNIYVARVAAVQITGNTRTKDKVIRRLLRVTPGMIVNTDWIKADYERLNSTGYFSKVNPDIKDGPDPKKPQDVTIVWQVTEQRTASASVGFGYSGGINGEGLYGTLGFTDTNFHGNGNSVSIQFQQGARTTSDTLSGTIPYLSDTPKGQKYSLSASLFYTKQTYYYPVYSVSSNTIAPAPVVGGTPVPIPVTLYGNGSQSLVSGVVSTSESSQQGFNFSIGRRLSDYITASLTPQISTVKYSTTVPTPYFFSGSQPNVLVGPTPNPLNSNNNINGSFGIAATSIANVNTGLPYQLNQLSLGVGTSPITVDDPYNPRHGWKANINELISLPGFGSSFDFTETTLVSRVTFRCSRARPLPLTASTISRPAWFHRVHSLRSPINKCAGTTRSSMRPMRSSDRLNCDNRSPQIASLRSWALSTSSTIRSAAQLRSSIPSRTVSPRIRPSGHGAATTVSGCASTCRNLGCTRSALILPRAPMAAIPASASARAFRNLS